MGVSKMVVLRFGPSFLVGGCQSSPALEPLDPVARPCGARHAGVGRVAARADVDDDLGARRARREAGSARRAADACEPELRMVVLQGQMPPFRGSGAP